MRPPGSVATINDVTTASTLRPSTKKFINPREILAENRRTTTSVPGATTSTTFLLNSESDVIFNYNKTNEINELLIVGDGESVKLKKNCLLKRSDSNYGSGKLEIVPKTITPSTSSIKSVSSVVSPEVAELNLHKKNNSNRFSYCGSDNGSGNITEFNFKLPDRNLCNVHLNYDYDDDDAADIIDSGSSIIDNDCIDCDLGGLCMNSACEVLFSTSGNSLGSHIKSQRIRTNFEHDQQQQKFITTANNSWKDHSHHSHSPHLNFNHAHPLGPSITTIIPPISKKSNQNPAACSVPIASYAASNNVVNNKLNKIKRVSSENGFIVHSPTAPIPATVAAINEVPKTKTTNIYVNNLNLINNFHHQQGIPASVVVRNKKLVTPVTDKETILTKRSNNQSLIYARKDLGPVERQIIQQKKQENRRSLQLNIFDGDQLNSNKLQPSPPAAPLLSRQSNRHSWYAATNSYETLFEDFEQEIKDSSIRHNLAGLDSHQLNGLRESASLLEPTIVQSRSQQRRSGARIIPSHTIQEGPHAASLGGPAPRIRRIEQLFKSLVGKKTPSTTNNGATTAPPPTTAASSSSSSSSISTDLSTKIKKDLPKQQIIVTQPSPQKQPSSIVVYENHPELRIDHKSPSEQNLCRDKRKISNSTTSLNSVQQKLWTVMPLLKRDTSCISLSNNNHQQLQQSSLSSSSSSQSVIKNSQNVKHSGYCRGDSSGDDDGVGKNIGLRKSETVIALSQSSNQLSEPIRPLNRLRNSASVATCSRCSSLLSLAAGSRYSLNVSNAGFVTLSSTSEAGSHNSISATAASASASVSGPNGAGSRGILNDGSLSRISLTASVTAVSTHLTSINDVTFTCKLCLGEVKSNQLTKITQCGCSFCTECMKAYMEFEILEGAYEISCPDAMCPAQGIISITEISILVPSSLLEKHHRYRLNREVEMDKNRTWCPKAGCETVCLVDAFSSDRTMMAIQSSPSTLLQVPCSVHCPTCRDDFCSGCKKPWHPTMTCEENTRRLAADGQDDGIGIPFDSDLIKCCPMCAVPIEKDEGCAQMMCKRCKHVFCWYCLASLDDDFLLRHYDKGPCKNKLGHSRASVVWHRAQVIGIFAGFGILLLVASPLLLLAAPCIVCCKCRICSGAAKLEDQDGEFDDAIALQR